MAAPKTGFASHQLVRDNLIRGGGMCCLMVMGALAVAGPSGFLAWNENHHLLEQRQTEIRTLMAQRDRLKNRVALLDPQHADPDLAGELLRSNLNVVHPDEMVMLLHH